MKPMPIRSSLPLRVAAAGCALGLTAFVVAGIDGLARERSVSPYAQVVELQRVVITGQRLTAAVPQALAVARPKCDGSSGSAAPGTC